MARRHFKVMDGVNAFTEDQYVSRLADYEE